MTALSMLLALSLFAVAAFAVMAQANAPGGLFDICLSFVERCVSDARAARVALLSLGLALVAIGFLYACASAIVRWTRLKISLKSLPLRQAGSIAVIEDENICSAFTHGLLNPRVHISRGLLKTLSKDELRAVFAHELGHVRSKDPLRLLVLSFFKDAFFYLPIVAWAMEDLRYRIETRADDKAKGAVDPLSLASALVKLGRSKGRSHLATLAVGADGGRGSDTVLRIKRLIDDKEQKRSGPPKKALLASAVVAIALFISFGPRTVIGHGATEACDKEGHCAMHADATGMDCKTHCSN